MYDFYLITSVIINILFFLVWKKEDMFNLSIKFLLLIVSITGILVIINTYHLVH